VRARGQGLMPISEACNTSLAKLLIIRIVKVVFACLRMRGKARINDADCAKCRAVTICKPFFDNALKSNALGWGPISWTGMVIEASNQTLKSEDS
jgi:hypothetical protein